jgi:hypothetical protein
LRSLHDKTQRTGSDDSSSWREEQPPASGTCLAVKRYTSPHFLARKCFRVVKDLLPGSGSSPGESVAETRHTKLEGRFLERIQPFSPGFKDRSARWRQRSDKQTPAMTYSRGGSHYHGPRMLNGRVRKGNGCGHPGVLTGKYQDGGGKSCMVTLLRALLRMVVRGGPSKGSMRSSVRLLVPVS